MHEERPRSPAAPIIGEHLEDVSGSQDPSRLVATGKLSFKSHDLEAAEANFVAALACGGNEEICRQYLARIYNLTRDWQKSLTQWEWLNQQEPTSLEPNLQVARAHLRLGHLDAAEEAFRRVLQLDPGHEEAQNGLAQVSNLRNRHRDERFKHQSTFPAKGETEYTDDQSSSDFLRRGKVLFKSNDLTESEAAFLAAIVAGANEVECRQYLARIYNLAGNWSKSLAQWDWLSRHDPASLEPHLQVARAHFRLGHLALAEECFEQVLRMDPGHQEARRTLDHIRGLTV